VKCFTGTPEGGGGGGGGVFGSLNGKVVGPAGVLACLRGAIPWGIKRGGTFLLLVLKKGGRRGGTTLGGGLFLFGFSKGLGTRGGGGGIVGAGEKKCPPQQLVVSFIWLFVFVKSLRKGVSIFFQKRGGRTGFFPRGAGNFSQEFFPQKSFSPHSFFFHRGGGLTSRASLNVRRCFTRGGL